MKFLGGESTDEFLNMRCIKSIKYIGLNFLGAVICGMPFQYLELVVFQLDQKLNRIVDEVNVVNKDSPEHVCKNICVAK